jgi:hypothetical protein
MGRCDALLSEVEKEYRMVCVAKIGVGEWYNKGLCFARLEFWMFMRVKLSLACLLVMNAAARLRTPETWTFAADAHVLFDIRRSCDIDIDHQLHIQPSRCLSDGEYSQMCFPYDLALIQCAACPSRRTTTSRTALQPLSTVPASLTSQRISCLDSLF